MQTRTCDLCNAPDAYRVTEAWLCDSCSDATDDGSPSGPTRVLHDRLLAAEDENMHLWAFIEDALEAFAPVVFTPVGANVDADAIDTAKHAWLSLWRQQRKNVASAPDSKKFDDREALRFIAACLPEDLRKFGSDMEPTHEKVFRLTDAEMTAGHLRAVVGAVVEMFQNQPELALSKVTARLIDIDPDDLPGCELRFCAIAD